MSRPNVLLHLSAAKAHMGGGAISMWRLAEALIRRGFPVRVTAARIYSRRIRGVQVARPGEDDLRWAQAILAPSGETGPFRRRSLRRRPVPVVAFVHSATRPVRTDGADLVVWGSAALRDRARAKGFSTPAPELVAWPPIDVDAVRVPAPGECVTLVNLMPEKGAHLFWELARRMPDVPFLGVRGGWGQEKQVIPNPLPGNAEVMKYRPDAREVYARTKVLLYLRGPDAGPDWLNGVGMAAMEAAVSGIPTLAHPGPGLRESLGDAGTWVDSDDPAAWEAGLRALLEPQRYAEASRAALARAACFEERAAVDRLAAEIERLAA